MHGADVTDMKMVYYQLQDDDGGRRASVSVVVSPLFALTTGPHHKTTAEKS